MKLQKSVSPPTRLHEEIEGLMYWKDYDENHKYLIAADVASGTGDDYLTFAVLDMTNMEFVADYCGFRCAHRGRGGAYIAPARAGNRC